ncbi:MAG: AI-2E family transporter, partial [Chloroflexota bacterium]
MAEKPTVLTVSGFRLWWLGVVALVVVLYLVRSILPPFLIGIALAYVLGPVATGVRQRWGLPHAVAVALVYLVLLGPLIIILVVVGPRFFEETRDLIVRAPGILARLIEQAFGPGPYDLLGTTTYPRQISDDLIGSARQSLGSPSFAIHLASMLVDFLVNLFL